MKKALLFIMAVLLALTLTGCSAVFLLPTETIRAPKLSGDFEGIQQALTSAVGKDIVMKYPRCKNTNASFLTGDVDGDGAAEVLAFYQKMDASTGTRINILKARNGKWESIRDMEPVGSELERVELTDLDNDGRCEIITGWSVFDSKSSELAIFSLYPMLSRRTSEKYTDFIITDVNGDGTAEIVILLLNTTAKTSEMFCYQLTTDELTLKAKTNFDGTVQYYDDIVTQDLADGTKCIFIDGYMGNGAMITEAVSFEKGEMQNVFFDENTLSTSKSYRPFEIRMKQNDGKVQIPLARDMIDVGEEQEKQYLLDWTGFDGNFTEKTYTSYYCKQGNYEIKFEKEWENRMICSYVEDTKTLIFYEFISQNAPVNEVFRITEIANDTAEETVLAEEMLKIKAGETSGFYATVKKDNDFEITADTLARNFILD